MLEKINISDEVLALGHSINYGFIILLNKPQNEHSFLQQTNAF